MIFDVIVESVIPISKHQTKNALSRGWSQSFCFYAIGFLSVFYKRRSVMPLFSSLLDSDLMNSGWAEIWSAFHKINRSFRALNRNITILSQWQPFIFICAKAGAFVDLFVYIKETEMKSYKTGNFKNVAIFVRRQISLVNFFEGYLIDPQNGLQT